jgi:hypothetical protein
VENIEAVVSWLKERGVITEKYPFAQDRKLGIWTTPNCDKVAWFKDPDGNILSIDHHLAAARSPTIFLREMRHPHREAATVPVVSPPRDTTALYSIRPPPYSYRADA